MEQQPPHTSNETPNNTNTPSTSSPVYLSETSSIIHLANVSAQYGSSIFADSETCTSNPTSAPYSDSTNAVNSVATNYSASLGSSAPAVVSSDKVVSASPTSTPSSGAVEKSRKKCCPSKHQLPMFLSKTYHMIDRCDSMIASWSENGDNFVVKNVERFAKDVLPQYFKHSNFSSFARQLNFYGFRKLKAEPILTADFDARTASYVRFFHQSFQQGKPELLAHIKRATKSDAQSKDDVDGLRNEISQLKDCICSMRAEYDQKMANMAFEFNRKFATLNAEYERLSNSMQRPVVPPIHSNNMSAGVDMQQQPAQQQQYQSSITSSSSSSMMQSLTHVAGVKLQSPSVSSQPSVDRPAPPPLMMGAASSSESNVMHTTAATANVGEKRSAEDMISSTSRTVIQRTCS
eukprot:CAMPEP_0185731676 /NCGR_PEP_ID=MMETSP1171-20130828/13719_1 /TAXON_ID=374046 /ORGANISM="Helicotheca tamensis, Strain CCMP826" /LENGTH=404 /DNA_ID=CAMNT_0028400991 /DNA_START=189 /DNA_END=1403 /DNA_ORIENTATION=+